jgi:AraC family transcriptional regulator, L-rhamnose operon transcriptional activator RhaR
MLEATRFERLPRSQVLGQQTSVDSGSFVLNGDYKHHEHEFYEAVLVLGGSGIHTSPLGEQTLGAGDAFFLRPGAWHAYLGCQQLEVFNCYFAPELLKYELSWIFNDQTLGHLMWTGTRAGTHGLISAKLSAVAVQEAQVHLTALSETTALSQRIARLLLFLGLVAKATPETTKSKVFNYHPAVLHGVQMLEANPLQNWTLTELADSLHVAPSYLSRLFQQHLGIPPMAYLTHWRAERAAALLLGTTRSIGEIAEEVGWTDTNYFSRRFKKHFGMSASAYRTTQV